MNEKNGSAIYADNKTGKEYHVIQWLGDNYEEVMSAKFLQKYDLEKFHFQKKEERFSYSPFYIGIGNYLVGNNQELFMCRFGQFAFRFNFVRYGELQ